MAEQVIVKTAELQLTTAKLTKNILRQLVSLTYDQMRPFYNTPAVIGWVHGSVLGADEDHRTYVIVKTGEGTYAKFDSHSDNRKKLPQIYVV